MPKQLYKLVSGYGSFDLACMILHTTDPGIREAEYEDIAY